MPTSCISNIENGKYRNPSWNMLNRIAKALNCDITEFFCKNEKSIEHASMLLEVIDKIIKERTIEIINEQYSRNILQYNAQNSSYIKRK